MPRATICPDGLGDGLDLRKVGMFGFSLGGYATANTLLEDERVLAGIDLDGSLQDDPAKGPLGEVARKGLDQPFLLFGSADTQRTDPGKEYYDPSWASFWAAQRGWKLNLGLAGTKQKAFTDYQFIFDQLFHEIYGDDPIITSVLKALVGGAEPAAQRAGPARLHRRLLRPDPPPPPVPSAPRRLPKVPGSPLRPLRRRTLGKLGRGSGRSTGAAAASDAR